MSWDKSAVAGAETSDGAVERVQSFDVAISINADGLVRVKETIQYDFSSLERHGIFRDIPVEYETKLGVKENIRLVVESVTDESGAPYPYDVSSEHGRRKIKIGDSEKTLSGAHTYIITYAARFALGYFDDFDELYWNVTGNEWPVPIERTSVNVALPQTIPWKDWHVTCYVGRYGSTTLCGDRESLGAGRSPEELVQSIGLSVDHELDPGEGATIAIGFPKGIVRASSKLEWATYFLRDNPFVFVPFCTLIVMFRLWWRRGRDPEGRGVVIPEYEVPSGLGPLEMAGLMHGKVTGGHIPAAIIDLAVRGYITIERTVTDQILFDTTDYVLYRTEKISRESSLEGMLLAALFASDQNNVALSALKNKFYAHIPTLEKAALVALIQKGLYDKNPKEVFGFYLLIGILAFAAFFVSTIPFDGGGVNILSIIIAGVIYVAFAVFMPRVTRAGAIMKERLLGLKDYLQIAEKRRIEFHNAPEKTPALFERLLPAALLLGVSDIWAQEFADVTFHEPEWYRGGNPAHFSAATLATDLNGFSASASTSLASAPSGSGSGGGGFSGGGGGGGGGGSW